MTCRGPRVGAQRVVMAMDTARRGVLVSRHGSADEIPKLVRRNCWRGPPIVFPIVVIPLWVSSEIRICKLVGHEAEPPSGAGGGSVVTMSHARASGILCARSGGRSSRWRRTAS